MRITVTGGAGYIGYHIVKRLLNNKRVTQVVVLDSFLYDQNSLKEFKKNQKLIIQKGDVTNIIDLVKAIKNTDVIISLAAIVGDPASNLDEDQTISTNYHATKLLVDLCNYYKVKQLIFASSCSVYGSSSNILNENSSLKPQSLYAKTRMMSEIVIKKEASKSLKWTILRFATVFGWSKRMRFDLVMNFLTAQAKNSGIITLTNPEAWRPLIHVEDIARFVTNIIIYNRKKAQNQVFNVGGDSLNIQIKDLSFYIGSYFKKLKIRNKTGQSSISYRVSFKKIKKFLGFTPKFTIDDGIKEILSHLKEEPVKFLDDKYYNVNYLYKKNHAN